MDSDFRICRCQLLYTEMISNNVLWHSTGNDCQYLVTSHNGREYKKYIYIYVCIYTYINIYVHLNHFAVQ